LKFGPATKITISNRKETSNCNKFFVEHTVNAKEMINVKKSPALIRAGKREREGGGGGL
jgi:hypothetical protein